MSKYQEQHYEDVAKVIRPYTVVDRGVWQNLTEDLADLFVADNPPTCLACGDREGKTSICTCSCGGHHAFRGGFDRERFLEACGLT